MSHQQRRQLALARARVDHREEERLEALLAGPGVPSNPPTARKPLPVRGTGGTPLDAATASRLRSPVSTQPVTSILANDGGVHVSPAGMRRRSVLHWRAVAARRARP